MSEAEVLLRARLRGGGSGRSIFRRQHPIGSLVVDFFCSAAQLAVEVDGATHWDDEAQVRDEARDRWLKSQGIAVVRVPASRVYRDLCGVVDGILLQVAERTRGR
jgi:very-short-patch-repair endonuclease